jgi:hypothetical protein
VVAIQLNPEWSGPYAYATLIQPTAQSGNKEESSNGEALTSTLPLLHGGSGPALLRAGLYHRHSMRCMELRKSAMSTPLQYNCWANQIELNHTNHLNQLQCLWPYEASRGLRSLLNSCQLSQEEQSSLSHLWDPRKDPQTSVTHSSLSLVHGCPWTMIDFVVA